MPEPHISALFSTYNRSGLLRRALLALERQTLGRECFEVIVVDDGSTDDTASLMPEFEGRLPLRWVRQENLGLAAGKNHALKLARAPIALFMDDDDVADPELLAEHLRAHKRHPDPKVAVLGYTDLAPEVASSPLMHFVTQVGFQLFGYPKLQDGAMLDYTYFWGGRSSCKMSILEGVDGPFDPDFRFGCEDIELGYRLRSRGLRVLYHRAARSTMIRALTFDGFCSRTERQGESNWVFLTKHPWREIVEWTELAHLEADWSAIADQFESTVAAARGLDRIAHSRIRCGIEIDAPNLKMLHDAYWAALRSHRIRGSWRARQRS